MEKIYIFGHKKPDTDSVTSAIALSYLKNKLGFNTEAMTLGNPNNETKFALDYFNMKIPKYLNDVKLQIKDISYLKDFHMENNRSIYEGFNYMNEKAIGLLPITNINKKFQGFISMKDITKYFITGEMDDLRSSYNNIIQVLGGKEIAKFDDKICGNVLIASYRSTTFIENVPLDENSILIVGDRHSIVEYAVESKIKLLILTGNSPISDKNLEMAKKNRINIIQTETNTINTSRKIWFANTLDSIILEKNVITFLENDEVNDFIDATTRNKYSNYPVLNEKNECLGVLRLADLSDANRKKVILVDHNEVEQSVDGLDEAQIIEIVDHHKLGNIGTSTPINFRNVPVGSTNTIIYMLYKENKIDIPKQIAGLMLSGIISDTLLFRSPTTTEKDKQVVAELAKIAEVDYEKYGMEMLKIGASLKGKTKEEILYTDFKNFTIDDKKIGIGQIVTLNIDEIDEEKEEYVKLINKVVENNDYYMVALFATDLINNGSYVYFSDSSKEILKKSFDIPDIEQGHYLAGCVSRKKQIIPNIINIIEKK